MVRGPLFVIGMPRSGTTMLRLALTSHSAICIPPESPFIISLHRRFGQTTAFDRASAAAFLAALDQEPNALPRRWQVAASELLGPNDLVGLAYPAACEIVYRNYALIYDEAAVWWGDKNNPFRNHLPTLVALYPQARFVHLVRDGRALLASAQQLATVSSSSSYFPQLPADVVTSAVDWVHGVNQITRQLGRCDPGRWRQVRYEDLVVDFETEMQSICTMLDVAYEPGMRNFDVANRNRSLEPVEYDAWKSRTRTPLTSDRVHIWKSSLSAAEIGRYTSLAGGTLQRFGYETSSMDRVPAAERARFLCGVQMRKVQAFNRQVRRRIAARI